jgi:hypothetical protein
MYFHSPVNEVEWRSEMRKLFLHVDQGWMLHCVDACATSVECRSNTIKR